MAWLAQVDTFTTDAKSKPMNDRIWNPQGVAVFGKNVGRRFIFPLA
jgi:hypothetical protein